MTELLRVDDLRVRFDGRSGPVDAVRGVSFSVHEGQTLAIVGESGAGKSVTASALLGLLGPDATVSGEVRFDGRNLLALDAEALRAVRGRRIAMVFQDPLTALNPVYRVGRQIAEALRAHGSAGRRPAAARAGELLEMVGIPASRARDFPHEFSGGMRQRVMLAMALAPGPDVLIADEPTTALDVTVQAQILELLADLRERFGLAVLLVTHDLGVVAQAADEIAVMYAGTIVEHGPTRRIFESPRHPYTWGLLESMPRLQGRMRRLRGIGGTPPSPFAVPPGCPFHPRCPLAEERCSAARPPLRASAPGHEYVCIHDDEHLAAVRAGG